MTDTPRVKQRHYGLRGMVLSSTGCGAVLRSTALICAAAMSAAALLLAGCGSSGVSSGSSARASSGEAHSAAFGGHAAALPAPEKASSGSASSGSASSGSAQPVTPAIRLVLAQSIIYTASLTVQTGNVQAAVQRAAAIVAAVGGYTAAEQESSQPGQRQTSSASLQLKIPPPAYHATLGRLGTEIGTQTALSQQAQDVTQQVADVASRVTSAQAAIAQLRTLLTRAGSISGLLDVQDQINSQESDLEVLQAEQRALVHATTFATVSLLLVSHHAQPVKRKQEKQRGFAAGLAAGWRGLGRTISWLLTVIGTVLPFALLVALAAGIGYVGWRRVLRHRPPPAAVD